MTYTILAADDSKTIRRALQIVFEKEDVKLILVNDGQEAIEKARALRPDLVIADHNMPTDGYEVAKVLRADSSTVAIPVLLLVGSSAPYDRDRYESCGAFGEIRKPFQSASLLKSVYNAMQAGQVNGDSAALGGDESRRNATLQGFGSQPTNSVVESIPTPVLGSVTPASVMSSVAGKHTLFDAERAKPTSAPQTMQFATTSEQTLVAKDSVQPIRSITTQISQEVEDVAIKKLATPSVALSSAVTSEDIKQQTREMIEKIVWEIVPELAETLIREEIARLMK